MFRLFSFNTRNLITIRSLTEIKSRIDSFFYAGFYWFSFIFLLYFILFYFLLTLELLFCSSILSWFKLGFHFFLLGNCKQEKHCIKRRAGKKWEKRKKTRCFFFLKGFEIRMQNSCVFLPFSAYILKTTDVSTRYWTAFFSY